MVASTVAVVCLHGDQKTPRMVTPAASTRKQVENAIITNLVTNLVIVELMGGRARSGLGLCHGENSLRGEIKQTDTSSRSSPSSLCPSGSDGPDFTGSA